MNIRTYNIEVCFFLSQQLIYVAKLDNLIGIAIAISMYDDQCW